ncbi:MAG: VWA domain-containing protein, partial [Myxococcota bacterium]|nr:VWA domain-containing protein [Myxococcota bacterium]
TTGGAPAPPASLGGAPVVVVGNGGGGGKAECVQQQVKFEPELPNVMLLIDGSNSMTLQDFDGQSRWDAVKQALVADKTGLIASLQARVRFGLTMYFSSAPIGRPEAPCPALEQVPVAVNNWKSVAASFEGTEPIGATPTGESIEKVWPALAALDAGQFRGPRMIVLATDGEPSGCDGNADQGRARSKSAVAAAYAAGISTFVIGVGPEASDQHLRELANLGQGQAADDTKNRFFRVLDTKALAGALAAITGGVQECVFALKGSVSKAMASSGAVTLNGVALEFEDPDGWHLEDESRLSVDGSACESLQSSAAATLDISFPCGVFIPS